MSNSPDVSRLDPEQLDEIVAGLDLKDAGAIERLNQWFSDLQSKFWDWLESLAGGEDGWLSRLSDWIRDLLPVGSEDDLPGAILIFTGLSWLFTAILLGSLCYGLYMLWLLYRPRRLPNDLVLQEQLRAEAAVPLAALPLARQPAALFAQACIGLVDLGRVTILPNSTNQMIAEAAELPREKRDAFYALARAADRGLFGGWQPGSTELAELTSLRSSILKAEDSIPENSAP